MKLCRSLPLVLAFAFALPALAQNTTYITASTVQSGGALLARGKLCLVGVGQNTVPISVTQGGGGLNLAGRPFCQNITNGALVGSLLVPNPVHTLPANVCYVFSVTDNINQQTVTLGRSCSVGGSVFSLDTANFNGVTLTPVPGFTSGYGVPAATCVAPSIYIQLDASVGGNVWSCAGSSWIQQGSTAQIVDAISSPSGIRFDTGNPASLLKVKKLTIHGPLRFAEAYSPWLSGCGNWYVVARSSDSSFSLTGSPGITSCLVIFRAAFPGGVVCTATPSLQSAGPIGIPVSSEYNNQVLFTFSSSQTGLSAHCFATAL